MQHITHTSGQANSLVTSDVINQVLQHIDKSVSVHIVWDIPGMAGGETTILHPVAEHDASSRRFAIADAGDVESSFSICYGTPELTIEENDSPGCHSVGLLADAMECWLICEF